MRDGVLSCASAYYGDQLIQSVVTVVRVFPTKRGRMVYVVSRHMIILGHEPQKPPDYSSTSHPSELATMFFVLNYNSIRKVDDLGCTAD